MNQIIIKHKIISKRTLGLVENLSKKSINVKRKLDYEQSKNIRKVSFHKHNTFKSFDYFMILL